jgi:hypothetical protein
MQGAWAQGDTFKIKHDPGRWNLEKGIGRMDIADKSGG